MVSYGARPGRSQTGADLDALRTRVASQAASLAESVTDGFDGFHLGAGDWVVELMAPEGPSTGGGALARQRIRLVPRRRGYTAIVVGSVDPVTSTGEVRTYDHVSRLHDARFGRSLEITADEYNAFLAKLDIVLNLARIRAVRVGAPLDLLIRRPEERRSPLASVLLFVVVVLVAAAVVYQVLRAGAA
jgi:hypothetical protein